MKRAEIFETENTKTMETSQWMVILWILYAKKRWLWWSGYILWKMQTVKVYSKETDSQNIALDVAMVWILCSRQIHIELNLQCNSIKRCVLYDVIESCGLWPHEWDSVSSWKSLTKGVHPLFSCLPSLPPYKDTAVLPSGGCTNKAPSWMRKSVLTRPQTYSALIATPSIQNCGK